MLMVRRGEVSYNQVSVKLQTEVILNVVEMFTQAPRIHIKDGNLPAVLRVTREIIIAIII